MARTPHQSLLQTKNSYEYISPNYLTISTDRLLFEHTNQNIKTITNRALRITNHNNVPVCYKIKSTTPFHYVVKPYEGTLGPREFVDIHIKMIVNDRNALKFNLDRFEVLARPGQDEDCKNRLFWQGAQSYKIGVELIETFMRHSIIDYKPMDSKSILVHKYSNQALRDTEYQLSALESEVLRLKERVNLLKLKNTATARMNPWNFMIAAAASILLAFIFS